MIGSLCERGRALMSEAVAKPSSVGQVDPDERQPDIGARKLRKGLLARGGADDAMAERREDGLEHVEVRHLPVDQQDRGYRPRLFTRLHRRGFSPRDRECQSGAHINEGDA